MADDREKLDDVSAMMEALWGPRTEAPAHLGNEPRPSPGVDHAGDGARQVVLALAEQPGAPLHEATGSERDGPEGRRAEGEDGLHGQLDVLRSALTAAVAAVEGRLGERIDALVAETHHAATDPIVHHTGDDIPAEGALIEAWKRESDERLAALEQTVGASLDAVEARMVTQADHGELRADLEAVMVEQLRLVLDEALKQGDARAMAAAAEVSRRQDALVGRDEFAVLRSELKDELSRHISAAQAELQRRVTLLDAAIADARAQVGERLDQMAALVSVEAARGAERASAQVGIATAPLHGGLRALQEQIQQISAAVAGLQQRFPNLLTARPISAGMAVTARGVEAVATPKVAPDQRQTRSVGRKSR